MSGIGLESHFARNRVSVVLGGHGPYVPLSELQLGGFYPSPPMSRLLHGHERYLDDRHRSGGRNPDSACDQARIRSHILWHGNRSVLDHRNHQSRERPDGHQFDHQFVSNSASSSAHECSVLANHGCVGNGRTGLVVRADLPRFRCKQPNSATPATTNAILQSSNIVISES